jgi:hypothetical protein
MYPKNMQNCNAKYSLHYWQHKNDKFNKIWRFKNMHTLRPAILSFLCSSIYKVFEIEILHMGYIQIFLDFLKLLNMVFDKKKITGSPLVNCSMNTPPLVLLFEVYTPYSIVISAYYGPLISPSRTIVYEP